MRKLAREAVIFCLLGCLLTVIAAFVVLERGERARAISLAKSAVHAEVELDYSSFQPIPAGSTVAGPAINFVKVPLTNGMLLSVRQCPDLDISAGLVKANGDADLAFQQAYKRSEEQKNDCRYFDDPYGKLAAEFGGRLVSVPLGDPNQVSIEKDYWAAYQKGMHGTILNSLTVSGLAGLLYGFLAGLGMWCLYRLLRFAVKG
jgi:hypothetical protein